MKLKTWLPIALALVLGVFAAMLAKSALSARRNAVGPQVKVVVAKRPIAPGEPTRAGRWWWESDAPKECGMHCAIETGGFEHELHAILGDEARE